MLRRRFRPMGVRVSSSFFIHFGYGFWGSVVVIFAIGVAIG